jgi:hypothetical protein
MPLPWERGSDRPRTSKSAAVPSTAFFTRSAEYGIPSLLSAATSSARHPQAFGELMLVPFMSCLLCSVQVGTGLMAAPGAVMLTPAWPSVAGPVEDQV